ncbi:lipopolysaccharide biosynthesis protein [Amedibacillus dolichus]|uniref:lipopolysaccharide biosynthesis protein n=1 Tax=Amedibacillus dolichus TaxID=31971 RepID=UPI0039A04741
MTENKSDSIKKKTMSNLIWRFAERSGAQGVSFIVSIVLARFLAPEAYGTVALVTVFTTILQVFVDSGLGTALIQKKNADDIDFSTVFYFNFTVCVLLYLGMFFLAPYIAQFYRQPELVSLIRVISLTLVISGVKNIQQAFVSRNMLFKRFFYATIGGTIFSAVLGITMAYLGFGAWSLVAQQLSNAAIDTLILWITVKWRPKWVFSLERLKSLFSFGWKLLVSAVLDSVYNNLRQLITGKMYTPANLAFYNKGNQFPHLIVTNINTSIDSVLLPVMSDAQDDKERVKVMTRRAIKTSTYVMAPLMMGLAFVAPVLIELLLTEKWLPCVPFLRIFCITYMFYPIHTANLNAIKAMGRSDLFLKLEIAKKTIGMVLLISTMWFGVMAMAYSLLVSSLFSQIINAWPNRKLLNYGYWEQLKDILPGILLAVLMGGCVNILRFLPLHQITILVLQIILGAIIYISCSAIFKFESFQYLWGIVKLYVSKSKRS